MARTRTVARHLRRHTIAYLALFTVLGGTAYAGGATIRSVDIVDGQVRSVDVADDGLTGADISEATLDVTRMGCQPGKVNGYARISPSEVKHADYRPLRDAVAAYNCGGKTIEVRRQSKGVYFVRFVGNRSEIAVATANTDGFDTVSAAADNMVSVAKMHGPYDEGAFRIEMRDADDDDGGSDPQDGSFNILVP